MATTFEEVFDFFMTTITDYRLITLFDSSQTNFNTYLSGWLIQAIPDFSNCDQSLTYTGTTFTQTLTQKNINILALLMKKYWLEKELDNILQMSNLVQDRDFKTYASSSNMMAKQQRYNMLKEEVAQKLTEYGLNTVDWSAWFNQEFYQA